MTDIQRKLFELQDMKYREFQCRLMPTVDPTSVIGVRTPELRRLALAFSREEGSERFLSDLPHTYYEENNLHAFMIERTRDYGRVLRLLDEFLPYVDNWATCDMMRPKVFEKHLPELIFKIYSWIGSSHTYAVRFGIGMMMNFYLDGDFKPQYPESIARIRSGEYYINMMKAWYFATALAKQYEDTVPFIENRALDTWTHNKAIQKALESYRVSDDRKAYLKTLKIK